MRQFLFILLYFIFTNTYSQTEKKIVWYTDYVEATNEAIKTKKTLMLFFTGSDWCIYCKQIEKNIFSKKSFINYSDSNLILLKLDFPKYDTLPENIKKQNEVLEIIFDVEGYPSVIFVDILNNSLVTNLENIQYKILNETGYFTDDIDLWMSELLLNINN